MKLSKRCLTCRANHATLYYHRDKYGTPWIYCNKCSDSMDLEDYCLMHGINMPTEEEVAKVVSDDPNDRELHRLEWPKYFIPLWDKRSESGVEYLKSRCLEPSDGMFYDMQQDGIVLPYYYENTCVGAQVRFIRPREKDGKTWKITTIPGTKLGKLFYGWNQAELPQSVKYLVITEGAFNAIALQQTFNRHYGGATKNPYRFAAASGSSIGSYRADVLRDEIERGKRVILAADPDQAGVKMLEEAIKDGCITHYTTSTTDGVDWNDILKQDGEDALKLEFLSNLRRV